MALTAKKPYSLAAALSALLALKAAAVQPVTSISTDPAGPASDTILVKGITVGATSYSEAELVGPTAAALTSAPPADFDFHWGSDAAAVEPATALQALGGFDLSNGVLNPGQTGQGRVNVIFSAPVNSLAGPELFIFNPDSGGDDETWQVQAITAGDAATPTLGGNTLNFGEADFADLGVSISHSRTAGANFTQNEHGVAIDLDELGVVSLIGLQVVTPNGDPSAILGAVEVAPQGDPEIGPLTDLDFGLFNDPDLPAMASLVITNLGATQNLVIGAPLIVDPNGFFSVTGTPGSIAPGSTGQFDLRFDSSGAAGTFNALLEFTTNDADEGTVQVNLTASVRSDPEIEPVPALAFGQLGLGQLPATATITVTNTGAAQALTLSNASTSGIDGAFFSVQSLSGPIAPGGTGEIEIRFDSAGATGDFAAELRFDSNDPDEGTVTGIGLSASVSPISTTVNAAGLEVLESIFLPGRGSIAAEELTNVQVFSFNSGGVSTGHLIYPGGLPALPSPRQAAMEDLGLNSGIINPGAGSPVTAGTVISDAVIGLGLRFTSPVADAPGADALFFELSVGEGQSPDGFTMALLDQNDAVIGNEVSYTSGDYSLNSNQSDSNTVTSSAITLDELNNGAATNGGEVDSYYNLLGVDFADFGVAAGTPVSGVYIRGAGIDTTLVVGLNPANLLPFEITDIDVDTTTGDVTVTWNSIPGRTYKVLVSPDGEDWTTDLIDGYPFGGATGDQSSYTESGLLGLSPKLLIRIEEE